MNITDQINNYIASLTEPKRTDIEVLHHRMLELLPKEKLWFLEGKNEKGKIVSNPNIGYGLHMIRYADGRTKAFYKIGLSATTGGISVYILGIDDKKYLPETYGQTIGKAIVTGYCIKFKALKDIHLDILETAILDAIGRTCRQIERTAERQPLFATIH